MVLASVFLYAKCVSASQLNDEINLQTSSNNLQAFPSVPKSTPEELRRDKRRLEEDRRVNGRNSNTPFQTPNSSFEDRLKPNRNDLAGHNSGSRRPSSSYTNLSAPNNRLPPSRTGRRLEHDRNVNSKNQIILAKTSNPSGNTRRPGINTRNEFDGRGGDTTRNRNQVNFNRSNQANIDSVKDKVIKRPHIDYRTLLDNGVSSSRKNEIFKQGMVTSTIYFISLSIYIFHE